MFKKVFYSFLLPVLLFSCKSVCVMPELVKVETVITDISYMETPSGIVQVVECQDGHVAYLRDKTLSIDDIGTVYAYFYPSSIANTQETKEFVECDILSIKEEGMEWVSKLIVTYDDNTTEYYDLYFPEYMYEEISLTGQINLTHKEFLEVLSYNIKNEKIES